MTYFLIGFKNSISMIRFVKLKTNIIYKESIPIFKELKAFEVWKMVREYHKYDIRLSDEEQEKLKAFLRKGTNPAMIARRVNVILAVNLNQDMPMMAKDAAGVFGLHPTAITNIKRDFIELDIDDFLHRKVRETPPREIKITGDVEAHIIALSCQEPPKGYARWTLKLLAKRAVELEYIDSISDRSVGTILKKANISLT